MCDRRRGRSFGRLGHRRPGGVWVRVHVHHDLVLFLAAGFPLLYFTPFEITLLFHNCMSRWVPS